VFVIKRNNEKNRFDWFTLCCEAAVTERSSQLCPR
jgi:hypothetical protein